MGVDLHRIGFGISSGISRTGFGTVVSFPSIPSTCPTAGTPTGAVNTQTYTSGSSVYIAKVGDFFLNQNVDYPVLNDGVCGTYINTLSPQNIVFKPYESLIGEYWFEYIGGAVVTILGNDYWSQESVSAFYHDGEGGYFESPNLYARYKQAGTFIMSEPQSATVPTGTGNSYSTGKFTAYHHDGAGYYYGSTTGSYYPYGTFIFNDGTYDYYWDGNGDYYYL